MTNIVRFGGPKAPSYELLSNSFKAETRFYATWFNPNANYRGPISEDISRTVEEQAMHIIEQKSLVDMEDVLFLVNKVRRLSQKSAIALLRKFGSISQIKEASIYGLDQVCGIGETLAERIFNILRM